MNYRDVMFQTNFDDEEISYWLAFDQAMTGIGSARVRALYEEFESLKEAWHADLDSICRIKIMTPDAIDKFVQGKSKCNPEKLLERLKGTDVEAIPLYHPDYPFLLRQINEAPMVLYVRGKLKPEFWQAPLAIVGSRKPSSYGKGIARDMARELAAQGVTIISGMAYGIDSLAHWGAIDAGGKTIAVLGCGADFCYPSTNQPLYNRLIEDDKAAVVSEFFPGTTPESWMFPARNRIISGLSRGVVIVEADIESGALITADIAFDQSREVFAIPGRIDNRMSRGTNKLIRECKAKLIRDYKDVMYDCGWTVCEASLGELPNVVEFFGREKEVLDMLSPEPIHFDHLCEKSGMGVGELSATLTMLELAGAAKRHSGDWYTRCAR